jgi:acylphosphatase
MKCIDIYIFKSGTNLIFPFSFMQKAYQIGIKGFVIQKNNDLFIEAEGEEKNLEEFIDFCERCQFLAEDEYVEIEEVEVKNYSSFEIIENEKELPNPIKLKEKKED